jgi:hypothetical protein
MLQFSCVIICQLSLWRCHIDCISFANSNFLCHHPQANYSAHTVVPTWKYPHQVRWYNIERKTAERAPVPKNPSRSDVHVDQVIPDHPLLPFLDPPPSF